MTETKGYTRTISTAELNDTPRVSLEQPTGDVYVQGWDKQEIEVSTSDPDAYFEVEQEGSQVTIRNNPGRVKFIDFLEPVQSELRDLGVEVNMDKAASKVERSLERTLRRAGKHGFNVNIDLGNWSWRGGRDYYIKVPHNCDLSLRTSSGDLHITGVSGTLLCQTSSGDLRLKDLGGTVLANSASGDVTIVGLEGKLAVRTASGNIKTRDTNLDEVNVQTASGDVELDFVELPPRDINIVAVSGDLTIYAPYDARFTLQTRTVSGSLSCGFPREKADYKASNKRETTLDINGGGNRIGVTSVSGDISIRPRKVPEADRPNPEMAGAGTTDLSRSQSSQDDNHGDISRPEGYVSRQQAELDILQKVGTGELSPQEAMQALANLADES
jgi:DUF4097 and DUF4098 domain-containing protein YvlB